MRYLSLVVVSLTYHREWEWLCVSRETDLSRRELVHEEQTPDPGDGGFFDAEDAGFNQHQQNFAALEDEEPADGGGLERQASMPLPPPVLVSLSEVWELLRSAPGDAGDSDEDAAAAALQAELATMGATLTALGLEVTDEPSGTAAQTMVTALQARDVEQHGANVPANAFVDAAMNWALVLSDPVPLARDAVATFSDLSGFLDGSEDPPVGTELSVLWAILAGAIGDRVLQSPPLWVALVTSSAEVPAALFRVTHELATLADPEFEARPPAIEDCVFLSVLVSVRQFNVLRVADPQRFAAALAGRFNLGAEADEEGPQNEDEERCVCLWIL